MVYVGGVGDVARRLRPYVAVVRQLDVRSNFLHVSGSSNSGVHSNKHTALCSAAKGWAWPELSPPYRTH